jgi:polar amino acid transport system substrate-binding protein
MSADSTVIAYAIKQSNGKLAPAGRLYDAAPYGWPVVKGSTLGPALNQALQHLIDNGDYKKICDAWGVGAGMIGKPAINGAKQ